MARPDVELSVTCWERTYREVLAPGFIDGVAAMNGDAFAERSVVINNVTDLHDALERAFALVQAGEISRFRLVSHDLDDALAKAGLRRKHLKRIGFYTDHFLVAIAGEGSTYLCHWDADAVLRSPMDWVTPTAAYLARSPKVLTGCPGWSDTWSMQAERLYEDGEFDLGYGFTDHVFVVERQRLARPVYRYVAPASWWYPTAFMEPIFEQRIDAYMRRKRLLRAVYRNATYFHDETMVDHPTVGLRDRMERRSRAEARRVLERRWPWFHPALVRRPQQRD